LGSFRPLTVIFRLAIRISKARLLSLRERQGEGAGENPNASDLPRPLTLTLSRRERGSNQWQYFV
jgi:hypothetical protein